MSRLNFVPVVVCSLCTFWCASWVCSATAAEQVAPAGQRGPSLSTGQGAADTRIDVDARKELLDALAPALESEYVFEEVAKQLAALVRDKQRAGAYEHIVIGPELARTLTDDLYAVAHDKHLRVDFTFAPPPPRPQGPPGPPPAGMQDQLRKLNGAIPRVEILDGNVGYMRVNGVPPLPSARAAVAAAFAFLHNTDALIIDNRNNGGGDPSTVAWYVSYLSEGKPFVTTTFRSRVDNSSQEFKTTDLGELSFGASKPVFVLNSPATFSGGEELAYDLQALKRAVVVGEASGGGANPVRPMPLGRRFMVLMPRGYATNPITGTNWEGVGVKPDVAVAAAAALSKAHELALDRLMASAADPWSRSMLEAAAMKLESIAEADAGSVERLTNQQIIGSYVPKFGPGSTVTILEKDGRLLQHVDGFADLGLALLKGNRYRLEGGAEGSITSFRVKDGKTQLLLESSVFPPALRQKQ